MAAIRRRSWAGKAFVACGLLAFLGLGAWAFGLVRRTREVQGAFDRAAGQAVQLTQLLDGITRLHQAGSAVLQSYAVGYQRLVFEKISDQYRDRRRAPRIPWEPSCKDCLNALDEALLAHQAQAQRVFDLGEQWEAVAPGSAKEAARGRISDELFLLEQRQGKVLAAFQDLETVNRNLVERALMNHQRNARNLYAFAAFTLALALGFLILAGLTGRQAQRARLAERLTRTLMNVLPDGLLVWNDQQRLVQANPAACQLLGAPEERLIGQPIQNWVPASAHSCLEGSEVVQGIQFTLDRPETPRISLEASAGCLRSREGIVHVGIFRDITRRLASEERLREAQRMEVIGTLAAGVIHDVKNLLTPIGMAEELLSRQKDLNATEQRLLQQIRKSSEAATRIMNQLLRLAHREREEATTFLDVNQCVLDSLGLIALSLGSGIRAETSLDADPASVLGSYESMVQVFTNLLLNAAQAMHGQGRLRVETSRNAEHLEINVSDTGDGISPEIQARIFEPLFTTKGAKGTGLGLFNVKQIVEGMGGTIQVTSQVGVGTTFHLHFPA